MFLLEGFPVCFHFKASFTRKRWTHVQNSFVDIFFFSQLQLVNLFQYKKTAKLTFQFFIGKLLQLFCFLQISSPSKLLLHLLQKSHQIDYFKKEFSRKFSGTNLSANHSEFVSVENSHLNLFHCFWLQRACVCITLVLRKIIFDFLLVFREIYTWTPIIFFINDNSLHTVSFIT